MVHIPMRLLWDAAGRIGNDARQAGHASGPLTSSPLTGADRACVDPRERALLVPYMLSSCADAEADRFEGHLLACETCFQDLKCLDRAGALIREFVDSESPRIDRVQAVLEARVSPDGSPDGRAAKRTTGSTRSLPRRPRK